MEQALLEALPIEFQRFKEVTTSLANMLFKRRLFPPSYPLVEKALGEAYSHLNVILHRKNSVKFKITNTFINYFNFQIKLNESKDREINLFRETCNRLAIGELEFFHGITKDELGALADILVGSISDDKSIDVAGAWMMIEHVKIRHRTGIESNGEDQKRRVASQQRDSRKTVKKTVQVGVEKTKEKTLAVYKAKSKMGEIVSGVLDRMEKIQSNAGRKAGKKILELIEMEGGNASTILLLSSLRNYDEYTFLHSVNVAVITTAMSKFFGYPEETINRIGIAALMHDIGKLYVSHEIIHKTGQLTPLEWQVMKRHPIDGERILREERVDDLSRLVAYEHHMRYDLKGYPIPKEEDYILKDASHLVRIADSYDALTTKRAYRRQIGPYEAIKLMSRSSGTEFHPGLFDSFLH
ncbi:MAG: HD domain-containing protein, partial [bacterium]